MRLGGPVFEEWDDPVSWVMTVRDAGYGAAFCPVGTDADDETVSAYAEAAEEANIVIAEVPAFGWNPIASDEEERAEAIERCQARLALAERIGARCCVNVAGSRGERWAGAHPENLSEETFEMTVDSVRKIVDAVRPQRTAYTIETMPWIFPHTPDSYLKLIEAVDRDGFAVHLDPVNLVTSPEICFNTDALLRECFEKLGPYIRSCHGKDIRLQDKLTVHLDEVRPGSGSLDYHTFLRELDALEHDVPLMLEHLPDEAEYTKAADYVRALAEELGVELK
jgi:sugar phosphate isomerase/epimerase